MADVKLTIDVDAKKATATLNELSDKTNQLAGDVKINIEGDPSGAVSAADEAGEAVESISDSEVQINADNSDLINKAGEAEEAIRKVPDEKQVVFDIPGLASLGIALGAVVVAINQVVSGLSSFVNFSNEAEKVEMKLVSTLKTKGEYTDAEIERLKVYASYIQKVTTVGDEETLSLITLATNMDIASEKRKEAVEGAIGLSIKFAESGLSQETAMKAVANAMNGNFGMLERYIPPLRSASSETEKMALLQQYMAEGFQMAKDEALSGAGSIEQYNNLVGDLKEKIGDVIKVALLPLIRVLTSVTQFLNDHPVLFKSLVSGVFAIISVFTIWHAKTLLLTAAQKILSFVMATSPIGWITIAIAGLIAVLASVISSTIGFAKAWEYVKASMEISWNYIKAFGNFLYSFSKSAVQVLTYPYTVLIRTVKEVFGQIGELLKDLFSGDFSSFTQKISEGFTTAFQNTNDSINNNFTDSMNAFDGLGSKSAEIWNQVSSAQDKANKKTKENAQATEEQLGKALELAQLNAKYIEDEIAKAKALNALERDAELEKARQAGAQAELIDRINAYYRKKDIEDEKAILDEKAQQAKSLAELKIKYISDTVEKIKAQNQIELEAELEKAKSLNASEEDISKIKEFYRQKEINDIRLINLEKARKAKEEADSLRSNEKTKLDAISAYYESIKFLDQDYYQWKINQIKLNAEKEIQALLEAGMGRIEAEKYIQYKANQEKKKLQVEYNDYLVKTYQDTHFLQSTALNAMMRGYEEFGNSLLRTDMTGKQRREAIWNAMKASFVRSVVSMTASYIKQKALEVLATRTAEAEKVGAVQASNLKQLGLSLITTFKKVGMALWEMSAKVYAFFASLGPFGVPLATALVGSITGLVMALRKGFAEGGFTGPGGKYDVAGLVHKGEVVYEQEITQGNLSELLTLRGWLQKGNKLRDILNPGFILPAPQTIAPQLSYASGGYASGGGLDMFLSLFSEMKQEIVNLKHELINKNMTVINQISANEVVRKADPALISKRVSIGDDKRGVI